MDARKFPRELRLHRQCDFQRVHGNQVYAADEMLVIKAAANGTQTTRIGISVSRQVGNAVCRNRWKRLVREAFRHTRQQLPVGLDLVDRPRRGATPSLRQIEQSLRRLVRRIAVKVTENA